MEGVVSQGLSNFNSTLNDIWKKACPGFTLQISCKLYSLVRRAQGNNFLNRSHSNKHQHTLKPLILLFRNVYDLLASKHIAGAWGCSWGITCLTTFQSWPCDWLSQHKGRFICLMGRDYVAYAWIWMQTRASAIVRGHWHGRDGIFSSF